MYNKIDSVRIYKQDKMIMFVEVFNNYGKLVRVYADRQDVSVPEYVGDIRIIEIASYCFAQKRSLAVDRIIKESNIEETERSEYIREICGDYLKSIVLPDSIETLESMAFYNCTSLEKISFGKNVRELGGDVFMNCDNIRGIYMRCNPVGSSGLKYILARISKEVEVIFTGDMGTWEGISGRLIFTEYYESYDEIAPAHIFGVSINGEGFRARKCFTGDKVDYNRYDEIFEKLIPIENRKTLSRLALDRVMYPFDLSEDSEKMYVSYINNNENIMFSLLIEEKDINAIEYLAEKNLVSSRCITEGVVKASENDWEEGAIAIISFKYKYYDKKMMGIKAYEF